MSRPADASQMPLRRRCRGFWNAAEQRPRQRSHTCAKHHEDEHEKWRENGKVMGTTSCDAVGRAELILQLRDPVEDCHH